MQTLEAPETSVSYAWLVLPRLILEFSVCSHAATALINFSKGIEHDILVPYLDTIVE